MKDPSWMDPEFTESVSDELKQLKFKLKQTLWTNLKKLLNKIPVVHMIIRNIFKKCKYNILIINNTG